MTEPNSPDPLDPLDDDDDLLGDGTGSAPTPDNPSPDTDPEPAVLSNNPDAPALGTDTTSVVPAGNQEEDVPDGIPADDVDTYRQIAEQQAKLAEEGNINPEPEEVPPPMYSLQADGTNLLSTPSEEEIAAKIDSLNGNWSQIIITRTAS